MNRRRRSNLAVGLLLILVGAGFLVVQFVPELRPWMDIEYSWPLMVVGLGALLLVLGLPMAATIFAGLPHASRIRGAVAPRAYSGPRF